MALFYDVTKAAGSSQLSGLIRVSEKLRRALVKKLGQDLIPVIWHSRKRGFMDLENRNPVILSSNHHLITPEVFSSENRSGFYELLHESGVKSAAVFHDAIPYKLPGITWPKSVERHPLYMRNLADLNHIFSVSEASQDDLVAYWDEQNFLKRPGLSTIPLGADFFDRSATNWAHQPQTIPLILNVGILEPRKNQAELLEVACRLWDAGLEFELHLVGRSNPHFGKPIAKKIKQARKNGYSVFLHSKQSDQSLLDLYSRAHFTVFNSIAEGFGLPVIESLWLGIPCITNQLPSLQNFVDGDSCLSVNSPEDLESKISKWLLDGDSWSTATATAQARILPDWDETVEPILKWKENS